MQGQPSLLNSGLLGQVKSRKTEVCVRGSLEDERGKSGKWQKILYDMRSDDLR